ncbi:MAG TPA: VWA domain-containing protein [Blastocatellia bacterium]|nr:VWA domain-containing protein [Blastocatellia bacterium]
MSGKHPLLNVGAIVVLLSAVVFAYRAKEPGKPGETAGADGRTVNILVTAHPHNKKEAEIAKKLTAEDFAVKENGIPQKVLSAKPATETTPVVEVLIQDNLARMMDNEINDIKQFIKTLPEGSRVLTGYVTTGTLDVRQDFTTDRDRAAASLRILTGRAPYNPYVEVIEGLKKFDSQPEGRRIIVLISDGLDLSHGFEDANPELSMDLARAIREAQSRGVAVFSVYAALSGDRMGRLEVTFGQGSLIKLSDDTGGEAYVGVQNPVTLSPYWPEVIDAMSRQWLVTYQSESAGSGFRRIEVTSESGLHLHHPAGYWAK